MGASGTSTCLASQVDLEAKPVSHTILEFLEVFIPKVCPWKSKLSELVSFCPTLKSRRTNLSCFCSGVLMAALAVWSGEVADAPAL